MKNWLKILVRNVRAFDFHAPDSLIKINISRASLLHNLDEFKKAYPGKNIAPVLKSNAYGHGLLEVAQVIKDRVDFFIIDSYFEAQKLRADGITNPLLIMGYVRPECMNGARLKNVSYAITSLEMLQGITARVKIHLKIDTGMHRQGILPEELAEALGYIKNHQNIIPEGLCSHLADADGTHRQFTEKQIALWNGIVKKTTALFPSIKYTHLSNTFGHAFSDMILANTSRLGIGLYGLANMSELDLWPVLEMKTILTGIKKIKKGDAVGYNNTFVAEKAMIIATIPLGYHEGLDRNLSNKGFVKIKDIFCPIIGRISMNITTIDVSRVDNARVGDEVQVISTEKSDFNSIESLAKISSRITYEIPVRIPAEIRRMVV